MTLNLVLASSYPRGAIGQAGDLPWSLPGDLAYFRKLTTRNPSAIIMGRHTWESFGSKPLPRRKNIVVSGSICAATGHKNDENLAFVGSLAAALDAIPSGMDVFVIGGAALYEEAARYSGRDTRIYHTEIYSDYKDADTFWKIPDGYVLANASAPECVVDGKSGVRTWFRRCEWVRNVRFELGELKGTGVVVNPEEQQYLDLLSKILSQGVDSDDRTGTGTLSLMGGHFRFNLRTGFPAMTTKPLFWKGVVEELLWILSGDTNAKHLASIGVHIWDEDTSRARLDQRGMTHLAEGDAGATYGFNMRHFGAKYVGCEANYDGLGVDQLAKCIKLLRERPSDRRIIINLWDPTTADTNCALPPCLMQYIFYVSRGELSCFTLQRSADMMLGVPFNIASSCLLTHIIANMTDLVPGDVDHNMVNVHVYKTHIEAAREQLERSPFAKSHLVMPMGIDGKTKKLDMCDIDAKPRELTHRDFQLIGYRCYPKLKSPTVMAA
jgi:dihydrofolate reductase/thymidylate synthase